MTSINGRYALFAGKSREEDFNLNPKKRASPSLSLYDDIPAPTKARIGPALPPGYRTPFEIRSPKQVNGNQRSPVKSEYATVGHSGKVGLQNLGNTCFMNSTLQCLLQVPTLKQYFLSGEYLRAINRTNPLGFKGKVAEAYADLLESVWSGRVPSISPSRFKHTVGEFAPRFSGYDQQDSSELLAFVLDGLHEDLNRIKNKPLTKPVESNGRPDHEVAQEAWGKHLLRNKSIIVDTFQGQLKSRLVCPQCDKISVNFDPFMVLSVPIPAVNSRIFKYITVVSAQSHARPVTYGVALQQNDTIARVKILLSRVSGFPEDQLILVTVAADNKSISKILNDDDRLAAISYENIRAYQISSMPNVQEVRGYGLLENYRYNHEVHVQLVTLE